MSRATARIAAMQMIFEQLAGGQGGEETLQMVYDMLREEGADVREGDPSIADRAWITGVLEGVIEHLDELDEEIEACSRNWTVERMPRVDLTILRLASWEILFANDDEVPGSVAINEAVELAGKYSEPASVRFINGVLGSILRKKEAAQ